MWGIINTKMEKLSIEEIGKAKKNPLFRGLPARLKDPKVFYRIEQELFDIVQTDHKHKTVKAYVTCAWCNTKRELKQNKIKSLGFKSYAQYMEWKKIMFLIINKSKFQVR